MQMLFVMTPHYFLDMFNIRIILNEEYVMTNNNDLFLRVAIIFQNVLIVNI